jgi:hypothetical protein
LQGGHYHPALLQALSEMQDNGIRNFCQALFLKYLKNIFIEDTSVIQQLENETIKTLISQRQNEIKIAENMLINKQLQLQQKNDILERVTDKSNCNVIKKIIKGLEREINIYQQAIVDYKNEISHLISE